MKKVQLLVTFLLFTALLFLQSCSEKINSPNLETDGRLSITFDGSHSMDKINHLKVLLARDGYESIQREINMSESNRVI